MIDLNSTWQLHPRVSVRSEPFGALLYHFETRKLSFLKDRTLLEIVRSLGDDLTVEQACDSAGIPESDRPRYLGALDTLAQSQMLEERAA